MCQCPQGSRQWCSSLGNEQTILIHGKMISQETLFKSKQALFRFEKQKQNINNVDAEMYRKRKEIKELLYCTYFRGGCDIMLKRRVFE
jgi:hypothetical protein